MRNDNLAYSDEIAGTGARDFENDLVAGLGAAEKSIPSKYFYDARGSALFEQITELPEYYPTRTELRLLKTYAEEISGTIGRDAAIIEFGAGSLRKIQALLGALEAPRAYIPIDISGDHLATNAAELARRYPELAVKPIVADFTSPLCLPQTGGRFAGFFPGSTIGNFEPTAALAFLRRAAGILRGSGLLIGVDLVKDPAILHAAYNDASGVTAAFNRNILVRANAELETQFEPDAFAHYAFYEPRKRRVEMHLVSRMEQRVDLGRMSVTLKEGEPIHTENSYKYTVEDFRALARAAGFTPGAVWCDPEKLFSIHWLAA